MDHFLNIDRVAFIGRTYAEYMRMFALEEPSLRNRYSWTVLQARHLSPRKPISSICRLPLATFSMA
jgi:hypothetical protein